MEKIYKGKACYNPSGRAAEYSYWACNHYVGCENDCDYCFNKLGVLSSHWSNKATLKKCFTDEKNAFEIFKKEVDKNKEPLQQYGILFTFTSDPLLPSTYKLTKASLDYCLLKNIPVKLLSKRTDCIDWLFHERYDGYQNQIAIGYTLTGHDEMEGKASPNIERIKALERFHKNNFWTFSSIEPIIDIESSLDMIRKSHGCCDLYKIGLKSGAAYNKESLLAFIEIVINENRGAKIYFKDSLLTMAGISRELLPINCVNRDFNIFKNKL